MDKRGGESWLSNHHHKQEQQPPPPQQQQQPQEEKCAAIAEEDQVSELVSFNGSSPAASKRSTRLKRTQSERVSENNPAGFLGNALNKENTGRRSNVPPPISPRKRHQKSSPPSTPATAAKSTSATETDKKAPESYSAEVQKRIAAKRGNLVHSMTFTAKDLDPTNRFLTGKELSNRQEVKRREAVWDLFQSEIVFLVDHLMVLKHVSTLWQP